MRVEPFQGVEVLLKARLVLDQLVKHSLPGIRPVPLVIFISLNLGLNLNPVIFLFSCRLIGQFLLTHRIKDYYFEMIRTTDDRNLPSEHILFY